MTGDAQHADVPDFDSFVAQTRTRLIHEAFRLCRNWHEAEDLVQLTLCRIFQRWTSLRDRHRLIEYSRQTLVRTFVSERRRLAWKNEIVRAEPPEHARADLGPVDDRVILISALNRLGHRQRQVILLRFWTDLSVEQTAVVLRCSPGTVTSQTFHALRTLRTLLRDNG